MRKKFILTPSGSYPRLCADILKQPHTKLFKSDTDNNYYDLMFDNDWIFFGDIFQINAAVKALCHTTSAIQLLAVKEILQ